MKVFRSKPIDISVVFWWYRNYGSNIPLFFDIPAIVDPQKQLNLYIESHDNLIISIYKK